MVVQRGDLACCVRCAGTHVRGTPRPAATAQGCGPPAGAHSVSAARDRRGGCRGHGGDSSGAHRSRPLRDGQPGAGRRRAGQRPGGLPGRAYRHGAGHQPASHHHLRAGRGAADRAAPRRRRVERPHGRSHRPGERGQRSSPDAPGAAQRRRPDLGQRGPGDRADHRAGPGEHARRRGPDRPSPGRADPPARHGPAAGALPPARTRLPGGLHRAARPGVPRGAGPRDFPAGPTGPARRPARPRPGAMPRSASRGRPCGTRPPARRTRTASGIRPSTRRQPASSSRWPRPGARGCPTCRSAACWRSATSARAGPGCSRCPAALLPRRSSAIAA